MLRRFITNIPSNSAVFLQLLERSLTKARQVNETLAMIKENNKKCVLLLFLASRKGKVKSH